MLSRRAQYRFGFALLLTSSLIGRVNLAQADSTRVSRPLTMSGAVNAVMPSVGADLSYQFSDRFAMGVQLTSLLWAHLDLSVRTRFFVIASETSGLYLGVNAHAWYSPLILEEVSPLLTAELGYESRAQGGTTYGIGLGAGGLDERRPDRSDRISPVVLLNLRIGKSW